MEEGDIPAADHRKEESHHVSCGGEAGRLTISTKGEKKKKPEV